MHIPRLCRAKGGCERHIVMASFSLAREIYIVGSSVWEIFRNYSKPCFTCFMKFPKIRGVLTCKQGSLFSLPLFPFPSSKVIYPFILFPSYIPTPKQSLKTKTKTTGQNSCRGQCNTHATPINLKANHDLSATQHSTSKHAK